MWAAPYYPGGYWPRTFFPAIGGPPAAIDASSADFRRERYYAAVYSRLMGLKLGGLVKTASRKVRLLEDMQPAELPALFFSVGKQKMKWGYNEPPIHTLGATVYLYAANPNGTVSADMVLNGLLDAAQAALKPDPGWGTQTLGGSVHAVWMAKDGDVEVFAGPNGERAAAIVPIDIEIAQ